MEAEKVDDEIATFSRSNGSRITSFMPLLNHLSTAHPDTPVDELVGQVDAAFDRMYRAGRVVFSGHRWLSEPPAGVAGFLERRIAELSYDKTTRTWTWSGTAWIENITVL